MESDSKLVAGCNATNYRGYVSVSYSGSEVPVIPVYVIIGRLAKIANNTLPEATIQGAANIATDVGSGEAGEIPDLRHY